MSLRNNVVVALAIVILAGQGCFDIGPLGLFDPNGSEECCSGGGGPNPLVLQSLYFGRSADTIVSGNIDTLRLYALGNYGFFYRPSGLEIIVGDVQVATVRISDTTPPLLLTIHGIAPGVTTLTARADGLFTTATLVVTQTPVEPVRALVPQAGPRRGADPPTTRRARTPTRR